MGAVLDILLRLPMIYSFNHFLIYSLCTCIIECQLIVNQLVRRFTRNRTIYIPATDLNRRKLQQLLQQKNLPPLAIHFLPRRKLCASRGGKVLQYLKIWNFYWEDFITRFFGSRFPENIDRLNDPMLVSDKEKSKIKNVNF